MPTLVLSPRFTNDSNDLWRAAVKRGWDVRRLTGWQMPSDLPSTGVALYGEPLFCRLVSGWMGWELIEPADDWLAKLPGHFLNRSVRAMTFSQATLIREPRFVKPANDKNFVAKVYKKPWKDLPSIVDAETPVLVSTPVEFGIEVRCFIKNGEIVTLSPYSGHFAARLNSYTLQEDEALGLFEFAYQVIKEPNMPEAFVLDVGQIKGEGWSVVEANSPSSSGIYGCDPSAVLDTLLSCIK